MIYRHPFPGPGLGVRILGEVKKQYADLLRQADAIFMDELYKQDLYQTVSQAFAVFLPIKSVGVMGDGRRYDYVIALRAVETIDSIHLLSRTSTAPTGTSPCASARCASLIAWRIQASSSAWLIPIQWLPGACQKYRK
jgi:GMP synthase PP-ATPase subunit